MAVVKNLMVRCGADFSALTKATKQAQGSISSLKGSTTALGTAMKKIGAAVSAAAIVGFGKSCVQASMEMSNALTGLQSITEGQGRSFAAAQQFIADYTKDGLIPATNAITAYKNLAMRGYDDSQIRQVMVALKDSAAFGRQASYSMGEAVQTATEGLKNENSILVDNAGVTKNVAKMWEEYAKTIGTTANNLTQQQKIQAEVNGILEESKYQVGDAERVAGTLSGKLLQLSFNFYNLKVAVGNIISPIVSAFIPVLNAAIAAATRFANTIATVVGALFGNSTASKNVAKHTSTIATSANAAAAAENNLASGISKASKAAQKNLASFDVLNRLSASQAASSSGEVSGASAGAGNASNTPDISATEAPADLGQLQEFVDKLRAIDISPLQQSLEKLSKALAPYKEKIGEGLAWFLDQVLVPIAAWTIGDVLPAFLDAVASALTILTPILDVATTAFGMFWDDVLGPILNWAGTTIVETFKDLADALGLVSDEFAPLSDGSADSERKINSLAKTVEVMAIAFGLAKAAMNASKIAMALNAAETAIVTAATAAWNVVCGIATAVTTALGAAVTFLTSPIGVVVLAVAALIAIIVVLVKHWDTVKEIAVAVWNKIKEVWGTAKAWFNDKVVQPVVGFFSNMWTSVKNGASQAWNGIKSVFSTVTTWFKDKFSAAWNAVKAVFSTGGKIFAGIKEGIASVFKSIVNHIISGINTVIAVPFKAINKMLNKIRSTSILGLQPFAALWSYNPLSIPQIPKLAHGAVIEPNKEFLAILGDQRTGRNIETPESLMRSAFREELAGFKPIGGDITIVAQVDGDVLFKKVIKMNEQSVIKNGYSPLVV